jgi:uncharacterized Ntn-hydrolase superfamily protein
MTYSIVARDHNTGHIGVAVQSHWFCVGSVVTWAAPGVGVVATQAFAERSYGPLGLGLMRDGTRASQALQQLLEADEQMHRRQVAMVDASGEVAAHTGAGCLAEAGHIVGDGFSVQANMMLRDTVCDAMASAYLSTPGGLVDRLLAALDAAEGQGGDIRGKQSAAILVVEAAADARKSVTDLRVDDHPEPLAELRRLVEVDRAYERMNSGDEHLARGEMDEAAACYEAAQAAVPDNVEFTFWRGVMLANAGRIEDARTFLERTYPAPGEWLELLRRLPAGGLLSPEAEEALLSD